MVNKIDAIAARRAFNKAANTYSQSAVLAKAVAEQLVDRLQYMKFKPKIILDVGAGTGFVSQALQKTKFSKVYTINIDFAINLLSQASFIKNTAAICANTYHLPLKNHSIDLLFSNLCLPFVDNVSAVFAQWQRVLKPGGLCLFTSLGPDTLKELRQAFATVSSQAHVLNFLDMHDIGDALLAAKFAEPVMDVDLLTIDYARVEDLLEDLKQQGTVNTLQQRSQGLFTPHLLQKMKNAYAGQDQFFPATFEIIYGCAWATQVIPNKKLENEIHVPMSILRNK